MKRLEDGIKSIITPQENNLFNKNRILTGKVIASKTINKEQYHIVNVENTLILAKEIFPLLYNDNTTKINKEVFLGRVDISDDWVILGYKSKIFEVNSIKIGHNIKINNDLIQIKTENTNLELTNNGLFINNKKVCTALDVPPIEIHINFTEPETPLYNLYIYESLGCLKGYTIKDIMGDETHLPDPKLEDLLTSISDNGFPIYNRIENDTFLSRNANSFGGLFIFFKIPLPPEVKLKAFIQHKRKGVSWEGPIIKIIDSNYTILEVPSPVVHSTDPEYIINGVVEFSFEHITSNDIIGIIIGDGQKTYECKDLGDHEVIIKDLQILLKSPLISYKKVNDIIYGAEIIPKKNIFTIPDYFFASELFNKNSHYITEAVLKNDIIFSRRAIIPTELLISHEEIFFQKNLIKEATNSSENNIIYKGTSKITLDELTKTIENLWQKNKILIDYNNYIEKIYFPKEITESNQLIEDCHKTIQIKEKEIQNFKDSPLSSKDHYKPTFVEYLIPQIDFISSKDYYSPIFIDPVTFIEKIFIHNKWVYETSLLLEIIDGYFIVRDQSNTITSILKNQIVLETINRTENVISSKDNYSPIFIEQLKTIEAFEFVKWQYSCLIQYESILSEILKPKKYYIITDELSFIDTFCSSFYNKDEYSITDELIFKTSFILPEVLESSIKFFFDIITNDNMKSHDIVNFPGKIHLLSIIYWNEIISLIRILTETINHVEEINARVPQRYIQESISQIEEVSKSEVKSFGIEHVKTITEHITYPIHTVEFEGNRYLLYIEDRDYPGPAHVYDLTTNQRYDIPTPNNRGRGGCILGDYVYIGGGGYNSEIYKYNYKTQVNQVISGSIGYDAVIKPITYPLFFISWTYQGRNYTYSDDTGSLDSIPDTPTRYSVGLKLRHSINNDKFFLVLNGGNKLSVISYSYSTFTPTIEYNEYNTINYSHGDVSTHYPLFALPDPNQDKIRIYNYIDTSEIQIPIEGTPLICVFPKKAKDFLIVITKNPAKIILLKKQNSTYTQIYEYPFSGTPTSAEISENDDLLAIGTTNSILIFRLNFGIISEIINISENTISKFIKKTQEIINNSEYNKITYIIKEYEQLLDLLNSTPFLKISSTFTDTEIVNRKNIEIFSFLETYKFPNGILTTEKIKNNELLTFFISLSLTYNISEKVILGTRIIEEILNFEETNIKRPEEYVHIETKVFTTPTNYTVFENLNSDLHDEYILDFEVLFPYSHHRDYGIYFIPGDSDDDQWIYAHIFGHNSGYGVSVNDIATRPIMSGVGWAYPSYSRGTTRIINKYYSNLFFSSEYNTILLDNRYKVTCTNTGISRTNRFPYDKIQIKCTEQSFLGRISLYQRTKPCLPPKIGEKVDTIERIYNLDKEPEIFYKIINQGTTSYSNIEIPFYIQTNTPDKVTFYINDSITPSSYYRIKDNTYMYIVKIDIPSFSTYLISIKYEEQNQNPIFTYSFHESFPSNSLTPDRWMPLEYPDKTTIVNNKLYFTGDSTTNYLTFKYIPPAPYEYTVKIFIESISRDRYNFGMTNKQGRGIWLRGSSPAIEISSYWTSMNPTFPSCFNIHYKTYYMIGEFFSTSCSIYNTLRLPHIFINAQGTSSPTTAVVTGIQLIQTLPEDIKIIPLNEINVELID